MEEKKIALIIDTEGWAFDNIAQHIKENLVRYNIDIIPGDIFEGNMIKLLLFCKDYDLIHFIWRGYLSLINRPEMIEYANSLGEDFTDFEKNYIYNKKISFSVCDHLYLDENEKWRTNEVMKYGKKYFVISNKLYNIYNLFEKKPEMIVHDGVDLKQYIPSNLERFKKIQTLHIGWVGNSKFKGKNSDMKGVEGIIKPAIFDLKNEGYDVELILADRNIKMIQQKDMPEYYNSIDLYICASEEEGTPLPILESMAMGIPVISTDVGVVNEVFGNNEKKYILKERSKECLKDEIKKLLENKQEFEILSNENLERIKGWDWKNISQQYENFFEELFKE